MRTGLLGVINRMMLRCFKDLLPASYGACSFGLTALLSSPAGALAFTRTFSAPSGTSLPEENAGGTSGGDPVEEAIQWRKARLSVLDPDLMKLHVGNLPIEMDRAAVVRLFEPFGMVHWASFLTRKDPKRPGKLFRSRGENGGLDELGPALSLWHHSKLFKHACMRRHVTCDT